MAAPKPRTILALDLLRFACAAMVVAYHSATIAPTTVAGLPSDWKWWSWSGWIGVEIFFVLSGYVIACSASTGAGLDFLKRRALRLAPAAWICACLTALVVLATGSATIQSVLPPWIASMTFWPIATQIDRSYWTLGIEVAFYILVATRLGAADNGVAIERVGLGLAVVSALYWCWALLAGPSTNRAVDLLLLSYGGFFAIGIALQSIRTHGRSLLRIATLALGLAVAGVEITMTSANAARGLGVDQGTTAPLAVFGIAVALIAAADRLQPYLERLIGARILGFAGLVTYPLYLIHQRIGEILMGSLLRIGVPGHASIVIASLVTLMIAAGIVLICEPPLRRWLAHRLGAAQRVSPKPAAQRRFGLAADR